MPIGKNMPPMNPEDNTPPNNQQQLPQGVQTNNGKALVPEEELVNEAGAYDQIAEEADVREVILPPETNVSGRPVTISEAIESGTDLTDMQYAAMRLFPEDKNDPISNISMVARIDPEVFLPLLHINVQNEIMCSDPFKPINVDQIITKHYYRQSIGLEGRGRIDLAELAGASKEAKERSILSSGLGGMAAG